jgi:hypothetical protein
MGKAANGYLVKTGRKWKALRVANVFIVSQKDMEAKTLVLGLNSKRKLQSCEWPCQINV